jgi:protein SCO1/2
MKSKSFSASILFLGVISFSAASIRGQAQPPGQRPAPAMPPSLQEHSLTEPAVSASAPSPAEKYFSDVELINQDGQKMRFYSDVLKDKVVVINTFFTTCTSVCPPMNRNLERVQEALGDRLGKNAFLVSISVDPEMDTPPRLKDYSQRFHARPGWVFLTGKKENVDWALYKLGQYVETKDNHTTIIIIGNEPKGLWKKAFGLAKPDELMKIVDDVINDR